MRKLACIILLSVLVIPVFAQDNIKGNREKLPMKQFNIGMDFFTDVWQDIPLNMDTKTINRGFGVFATYNFALADDYKWTFSPGLGINTTNLYSNCTPITDGDSTTFTPIESSIDYKNNKITFTTLDIPLEIRYNPGNFHFALYAKFGLNITTHTKYRGPSLANTEVDVKEKNLKIGNVENWRISSGVRIGYKWVHVFGQYSLTKMFDSGSGTEMYPITFGVTLMPFRVK